MACYRSANTLLVSGSYRIYNIVCGYQADIAAAITIVVCKAMILLPHGLRICAQGIVQMNTAKKVCYKQQAPKNGTFASRGHLSFDVALTVSQLEVTELAAPAKHHC